MKQLKRFVVSGVTLFVLMTMMACAAAPARVAQLEALTDIEMGIPQQDVYVEGDDGMLYRVHQDDLTDEILAQPAYATAEYNPPDLFELSDNPRGPYAKGEPLDFTFGEFIDATGHAEYIKHASGFDEVLLVFENLRPNGVYTLWCVLMWPPPATDALEIPCGAPDGSQVEYQADADGNLEAHLRMSAMPYSTAEQVSNLCLAYHSDDQTHGHVVGDYGKNAHIQLCFDVPPQDSDLWQTRSVVSPAGM